VHHIDGFPGAMFPPSTRLDFDQRDAFTYTARRSEVGLLERLPTFTHQPRPLNALYIQSNVMYTVARARGGVRTHRGITFLTPGGASFFQMMPHLGRALPPWCPGCGPTRGVGDQKKVHDDIVEN